MHCWCTLWSVPMLVLPWLMHSPEAWGVATCHSFRLEMAGAPKAELYALKAAGPPKF